MWFKSEKFDNVIFLVAHSFVVSELRHFNIRKKAYSFDWNIITIETVLLLLKNEFKHFVLEVLSYA